MSARIFWFFNLFIVIIFVNHIHGHVFMKHITNTLWSFLGLQLCCICYVNLLCRQEFFYIFLYIFIVTVFVTLIHGHVFTKLLTNYLLSFLGLHLCCICYVNLLCLQEFFLHIYCYIFCKSHSWTRIHETYYEHLMIILRIHLPFCNCYVNLLCQP